MKYPPHHAVEMLRQYADGEIVTLPLATVYGYGEIDPRRIKSVRELVDANGQTVRVFLEVRPATRSLKPLPLLARKVAAAMAHEAITQLAAPDLGQRDAKSFARKKCLELWPQWAAIQRRNKSLKVWGTELKKLPGEDRVFRNYRQETWALLKRAARGFLVWSGTREDFSDFVAVLFLTGSKRTTSADGTRIYGPAWIWHWGQKEATFDHRAELLVPSGNE